jgi:hypothetical protein
MPAATHYRVNRPLVAIETIDGEVVMIDFDSGEYFSATKVGAEIIGCIELSASTGQIVACLAGRYDGPMEAIRAGVESFLSRLQDERLIIEGTAANVDLDAAVALADEAAIDGQRPPFEEPVLQKFTDIQDLLLLDPIHDVEEAGWPMERRSAA